MHGKRFQVGASVVAFLTSFFSGACAPPTASAAGSEGAPFEPACRVDTERFEAYRWGEDPWTPISDAKGELVLAYGAAPLRRDTRVLLPFDEGQGNITHDLADGSRAIELPDERWVPGRFGPALSIRRGDTPLEVEAEELLKEPFTIAFWYRADIPSLPQVLLDSELFELRLTYDGRVRATWWGEEPPVSLESEPLPEGRWNHVAVTSDATEFDQVRLIANETAWSKKRSPRPDITDSKLTIGARRGERAEYDLILDDFHIEGRLVQSRQLLEAWPGRARPGAQRLELASDSSLQSRELWWPTLMEARLVGSELEKGALDFIAFTDQTLERADAQWTRIETDRSPWARTTHPTVYLDDGRVFLFGGETRDSHGYAWRNTNDTWIYLTREQRWQEVTSAFAPPPSCHQPAAFSPDHGVVLYAGGLRNDSEGPLVYDSTWLFDVESREWRESNPAGQKFPTSVNAGLVYHPHFRRFIHFPQGRRRVRVFDPEAERWIYPRDFVSTDEAGARLDFRLRGSPMVGYSPETDEVVLFGGGRYEGDQGTFFNDTAVFDAKENRVTVLDCEGPAPRVRSGFAFDQRRGTFLLFGGVRGQESQRFDDLWEFDPRTRTWTELVDANTPTPRGGYYGMAYDPELDRHYLLCGRNAFHSFLSEVQELRLDPDAIATATYTFDTRRIGPRSGLWAVQTGEAVSASIRFGDEEGRWGPWTDPSEPAGRAASELIQVRLTFPLEEEGATAVRLHALGFGDEQASDMELPSGFRKVRWDLQLPAP